MCVSNHVSTALEFVFLTCPHLCLCVRPPFCQQGSWNIFQWIFFDIFLSIKEAGTCLDECNLTTSNSFTSKHLKDHLGIGTPHESRKSVCNVFAYSRPASLPQSVGTSRQRHWERFSDLVTQLTMSDKLRNSKSMTVRVRDSQKVTWTIVVTTGFRPSSTSEVHLCRLCTVRAVS